MKKHAIRIIALSIVLLSSFAVSANLAFAQACSPVVGYYDMQEEGADPRQLTPITTAGKIAVALSNVDAASLTNLNVLYVQNQRVDSYSPEYLTNLAAIDAAVQNGMVLLMHDSTVVTNSLTAAAVLPGASAVQFFTSSTPENTKIDPIITNTLVTNGPGGVIGATTLDNQGQPSNKGYALQSSLPTDALKILSTNVTTHTTMFAYPHGRGWVVYSTIPVGYFQEFLPTGNVASIFSPNAIAYAAFISCKPTLSLAATHLNMHGQTQFSVPVTFTTNSGVISSLDFTMDYDQSCLSFDSVTDSNNDGIPNAVTGLPGGFDASFLHNAGNGSVRLLVNPPFVSPLPILNDGGLVTFTVDVQNSCINTTGITRTVAFTLSPFSFGGNLGQNVFGQAKNGAYTLRYNAYPTDIALNSLTVFENLPANTLVGNLTTTDLDSSLGDLHVYSLVAGAGSTDNGFFTVNGNQIKTATPFNFESKKSYAIRLRTTDSYAGTYEEALTIAVIDVNEAPTNIGLSGNTLNENAMLSTLIGNLSTSDKDLADDAGANPGIIETHIYNLPLGQLDNSYFAISGTQLLLNTSVNYEVKKTYNVYLRTTDTGNQSFEKVFTIVVNNLNDQPVANDDPTNPTLIVLGNSSTITIPVLANDSDQDGNPLTIASVNAAAHGTSQNANLYISYTAQLKYNGADSFNYAVSDGSLSDSAAVNLYVIANDQRADCNSDGVINAADFAALVLEIFDTDASLDWWRIYEQGFTGSPRGCDANGSENGFAGDQESVQASDIICTTLIFFDGSCTSTAAASRASTPASLAIQEGLTAAPGDSISVPVTLSRLDYRVAAATFALKFDPAHLIFDPTDLDGDRVPDAVQFSVPAGLNTSIRYNPSESRIEIAIFGLNLPMPLLEDGTLATITLGVKNDVTVASTALVLEKSSLGNDTGASVPTLPVGASISFTGTDIAPKLNSVFLPVVIR